METKSSKIRNILTPHYNLVAMLKGYFDKNSELYNNETILEYIKKEMNNINNSKLQLLELISKLEDLEYIHVDNEVVVENHEQDDEHVENCPICKSELISGLSGGVHCSNNKCDYWFCY